MLKGDGCLYSGPSIVARIHRCDETRHSGRPTQTHIYLFINILWIWHADCIYALVQQ